MDVVGWQVGLDRKTFIQKFLEEVLPGLLAKKKATAAFVGYLAAGVTHHLKNVCDGIVHITVLLPFEILDPHYNYHVGKHWQNPRGFLIQSNTLGALSPDGTVLLTLEATITCTAPDSNSFSTMRAS